MPSGTNVKVCYGSFTGLQPEDILQPLLFTAAETGAKELIEIIFTLPVGRILFEAYRNESPLPEDIAEENGHEEIAEYLRGITKRYLNLPAIFDAKKSKVDKTN